MDKIITTLSLIAFLAVFLFLGFSPQKPSTVEAFDRFVRRSNLPAMIDYSPVKISPILIKPRPTFVPPLPLPSIWNNRGVVTMSATVFSCGRRNPFIGVFKLCRDLPDSTKESNTFSSGNGISCTSLSTDKSGYGKVSVSAGNYIVHPPYWCPPGANCITNMLRGNATGISSLIADPYAWKIDPEKFSITPKEVVDVTAEGFNRMLMCPIQLEE